MSSTPGRGCRRPRQAGLGASLEIDLGDVAGDDDLGAETEPGEEHLHLLGARVLRLVEDDERVVQGAAPHEGQRRDLDRAALEVGVDPLRVEHVVEGVEEGSQVGVDLRLDVAGKEAESLAGLDRGPGQDHAADVAAREGGGGHRHGQEGLAGAGGPDPEGDRVPADRVDVLLLVDRLRRDPRVAVLPDDVLEDLGRALVLVEGAGDRLDRAGGDLVPLLDQVDQLADDRLGGPDLGGVSVKGEDIAAQKEVDVEMALERPQDRVLGARPAPRRRCCRSSAAYEPSFSRTAWLTRLPSARPPTFGISTFITPPMSFASLAPDSSTAPATSPESSSSESCSGR